MKHLLIIASLIMTVPAGFAGIDFNFNGQKEVYKEDTMKVSHTEYKTETYEGTCSRRVHTGYTNSCRRVCKSMGENQFSSLEKRRGSSRSSSSRSSSRSSSSRSSSRSSSSRSSSSYGSSSRSSSSSYGRSSRGSSSSRSSSSYGSSSRGSSSSSRGSSYNSSRGSGRRITRNNGGRRTTYGSSSGRSSGGSGRSYGGRSYGGSSYSSCSNVCSRVATYGSESYSCTKTRQVPFQVFDYNLNAKVRFYFIGIPEDVKFNAHVKAIYTKTGEVVVSILGAKKHILYGKIEKQMEGEGTEKDLHVGVSVKFLSQAEVLSPIYDGISDMKLSHGKLSFKIGRISRADKFKLGVKIFRDRLLFKDKLLWNKPNFKAYSITPSGKKFLISFNIKKGIKKRRRHRFELIAKVALPKLVFNRTEVPTPVAKKSIRLRPAKKHLR